MQSGLGETQEQKYTLIVDDLSTIITLLGNMPTDWTPVPGKKNLSSLQEELIYFAFQCLFFACKKMEFLSEVGCSTMIRYALIAVEKNFERNI